MAKGKKDTNKELEAMRERLEYESATQAFEQFVERFNNLSPTLQSKLVSDVSIKSFRRSNRHLQVKRPKL